MGPFFDLVELPHWIVVDHQWFFGDDLAVD